jgi:hypothetical protein
MGAADAGVDEGIDDGDEEGCDDGALFGELLVFGAVEGVEDGVADGCDDSVLLGGPLGTIDGTEGVGVERVGRGRVLTRRGGVPLFFPFPVCFILPSPLLIIIPLPPFIIPLPGFIPFPARMFIPLPWRVSILAISNPEQTTAPARKMRQRMKPSRSMAAEKYRRCLLTACCEQATIDVGREEWWRLRNSAREFDQELRVEQGRRKIESSGTVLIKQEKGQLIPSIGVKFAESANMPHRVFTVKRKITQFQLTWRVRLES